MVSFSKVCQFLLLKRWSLRKDKVLYGVILWSEQVLLLRRDEVVYDDNF
jgi:hypothetical protein